VIDVPRVPHTPPHTPLASLYQRLGPAKIRALVQALYPLIKAEPGLGELFPDELSETMNKQEAFLTGLFGGPQLYAQQYGPPRLRARHLPFAITPALALAWFGCFSDALGTLELDEDLRQEVLAGVGRLAAHMVNTE
jgi:hemoglobin